VYAQAPGAIRTWNLHRERFSLRVIGLTLTLLLLFGITYVAFAATEPAFPGAELAVLIGFVLLIANLLKRALVGIDPAQASQPEPQVVAAEAG
jgi:hypothetical protein